MPITRIEKLTKRVEELYQSQSKDRADWADWLFANHVFVVAETAARLAERFGAKKEWAMAAGMLHDIADAVMRREDPQHEEESLRIARGLLQEVGFLDEEICVIVDDAIRNHGCHNGSHPTSLEGQVMATADAVVHLQSDFYDYAVHVLKEKEAIAEIRNWALPKLERDFHQKIFFSEVREEVRLDYERWKRFFSQTEF